MVSDCEVIIAGTETLSDKVLSAAKNLRLISRVGIGLDSVDLLSARRKGIAISYTPDAPAPAVADLTMGLMYSLLRNIHVSNLEMHNGNWHRHFGRRLEDCTVGLLGTGRVGSKVASNLIALGCKRVMYYDKNVRLENESQGKLSFANISDILSACDIVSLHLPLDHGTMNLITIDQIKTMQRHALLVNTSRGGIINESDLKFALNNGLIGGAAVDAVCY